MFISDLKIKIFVQNEDLTEEGRAYKLIRLDAPKSNIILAFQAPDVRKFTEFAIT